MEITPLPIEIPLGLGAELLTVEVPVHRAVSAPRPDPAVDGAAASLAPVGVAVAGDAEEAAEPRRRRRRSSATV